MRKLAPYEIKLLQRIAALGGSYCPARDLDPQKVRALHELVKAKRLDVEPNDGAPPRYVLTTQGWADAA